MNSSLDTTNVVQVCTLVIEMCPMNSEREINSKYLRKSCYHRIKCTAATFLAALMWRGPLNSVALATITHKKLKGVSDEIDTQVRI